eukprot:1150866-Pelagomonas_calceolata.AAC.6
MLELLDLLWAGADQPQADQPIGKEDQGKEEKKERLHQPKQGHEPHQRALNHELYTANLGYSQKQRGGGDLKGYWRHPVPDPGCGRNYRFQWRIGFQFSCFDCRLFAPVSCKLNAVPMGPGIGTIENRHL